MAYVNRRAGSAYVFTWTTDAPSVNHDQENTAGGPAPSAGTTPASRVGWHEGDVWIRQSPAACWILVDATTGAAVWLQLA